MTRFLVVIASLFLALGIAWAGSAPANAGKEISTATVHAGLAAKQKDIKNVHLHLHHAVNCLVGPKGKEFAKKAGDPCKGMGDGAINDTKDPDMKKQLRTAIETAQAGIASKDLTMARNMANEVVSLLNKAQAAKQADKDKK